MGKYIYTVSIIDDNKVVVNEFEASSARKAVEKLHELCPDKRKVLIPTFHAYAKRGKGPYFKINPRAVEPVPKHLKDREYRRKKKEEINQNLQKIAELEKQVQTLTN